MQYSKQQNEVSNKGDLIKVQRKIMVGLMYTGQMDQVLSLPILTRDKANKSDLIRFNKLVRHSVVLRWGKYENLLLLRSVAHVLECQDFLSDNLLVSNWLGGGWLKQGGQAENFLELLINRIFLLFFNMTLHQDNREQLRIISQIRHQVIQSHQSLRNFINDELDNGLSCLGESIMGFRFDENGVLNSYLKAMPEFSNPHNGTRFPWFFPGYHTRFIWAKRGWKHLLFLMQKYYLQQACKQTSDHSASVLLLLENFICCLKKERCFIKESQASLWLWFSRDTAAMLKTCEAEIDQTVSTVKYCILEWIESQDNSRKTLGMMIQVLKLFERLANQQQHCDKDSIAVYAMVMKLLNKINDYLENCDRISVGPSIVIELEEVVVSLRGFPDQLGNSINKSDSYKSFVGKLATLGRVSSPKDKLSNRKPLQKNQEVSVAIDQKNGDEVGLISSDLHLSIDASNPVSKTNGFMKWNALAVNRGLGGGMLGLRFAQQFMGRTVSPQINNFANVHALPNSQCRQSGILDGNQIWESKLETKESQIHGAHELQAYPQFGEELMVLELLKHKISAECSMNTQQLQVFQNDLEKRVPLMSKAMISKILTMVNQQLKDQSWSVRMQLLVDQVMTSRDSSFYFLTQLQLFLLNGKSRSIELANQYMDVELEQYYQLCKDKFRVRLLDWYSKNLEKSIEVVDGMVNLSQVEQLSFTNEIVRLFFIAMRKEDRVRSSTPVKLLMWGYICTRFAKPNHTKDILRVKAILIRLIYEGKVGRFFEKSDRITNRYLYLLKYGIELICVNRITGHHKQEKSLVSVFADTKNQVKTVINGLPDWVQRELMGHLTKILDRIENLPVVLVALQNRLNQLINLCQYNSCYLLFDDQVLFLLRHGLYFDNKQIFKDKVKDLIGGVDDSKAKIFYQDLLCIIDAGNHWLLPSSIVDHFSLIKSCKQRQGDKLERKSLILKSVGMFSVARKDKTHRAIFNQAKRYYCLFQAGKVGARLCVQYLKALVVIYPHCSDVIQGDSIALFNVVAQYCELNSIADISGVQIDDRKTCFEDLVRPFILKSF